MALTKSSTVIHDDTAVITAQGSQTDSVLVSATYDVSDAYAASVRVRLKNGATGPTTQAQCQVQISEDTVAGNFMTIAVVGGSIANYASAPVVAGLVESVVQLPDTAKQLRLVSGRNTGQNVSIRAVLDKVTAL